MYCRKLWIKLARLASHVPCMGLIYPPARPKLVSLTGHMIYVICETYKQFFCLSTVRDFPKNLGRAYTKIKDCMANQSKHNNLTHSPFFSNAEHGLIEDGRFDRPWNSCYLVRYPKPYFNPTHISGANPQSLGHAHNANEQHGGHNKYLS